MKKRHELAYDRYGDTYSIISKTIEPGHEDAEEDIPWQVEATGLPYTIAVATLKGLRHE